MSQRTHRFVNDTPVRACTRGCVRRNRHTEDCNPKHVDDCGGCKPRDAAPSSPVCRGCLTWLERNVAEMPALYDDLTLALRRDTGGGQRVSGQGETPTFISGPVADHRDQIRHDLAWWAVEIRDRRGLASLPADTVPACAAWLLVHLPWCAAQGWVPDMCDVMAGLRRRGFALAYPSGRRSVPCGPCVALAEGRRCPGILTALVAPSDDLLPGVLTCSEDPVHEWPARRWLELGRKIRRGEAVA